MKPAKIFFIIAGEPSGDRLGAALMAGLKSELNENVRFIGVGGPAMEEQGLDSLFPMENLSVMGLVEVLKSLPKLLKLKSITAQSAIDSKPDAIITIDSPDFCLRVASKVKSISPNTPVIHYVAPSVWAWRPKRAQKMAKSVDHVLALLPFEPPYMHAAGMSCDFVGHPVVTEEQADTDAATKFRNDLGVAPDQRLISVLPGSRSSEVSRLGPVFRDVVTLLRKEIPDLQVVIPSVPNRVEDNKNFFGDLDVHILDPREKPQNTAQKQKRTCFAASDVALAASGTVSLELAAAGTPMVIAYKMNAITTFLAKRMVKLDSVTLVNIITKKQTVPEFLLEKCEADKIAEEILYLLNNSESMQTQKQAFIETMDKLGAGGEPPGLRAAKSVLDYLERK